MSGIQFKTKLYQVGTYTILRLPKEVSAQLPSRGQTMVYAIINDYPLKTPLEPDGQFSHWLQIDQNISRKAHISSGDTVNVNIQPIDEWVEPDIPADLRQALSAHPQADALWQQITPLSRWEWIRWIRSTANQTTRQKRIQVACSKLTAGKRRPCCWNRNLCTEPSVSKSGILVSV